MAPKKKGSAANVSQAKIHMAAAQLAQFWNSKTWLDVDAKVNGSLLVNKRAVIQVTWMLQAQRFFIFCFFLMLATCIYFLHLPFSRLRR